MNNSFEKYLTESEREFFMLSELLEAKFLAGEILNDENGQAFLKTLMTMRKNIMQKAKGIRKDEEEKNNDEKNLLKETENVCDYCLQIRKLTRVGEGRNANGDRVREFKCHHCGKRFFNPVPFEDEAYISFIERFIEQFENGDEEGLRMAERLLVTSENFRNVKERLKNFKRAVEEIEKAERLTKLLSNEAELTTKNMVKTMYEIYGDVLATQKGKPD